MNKEAYKKILLLKFQILDRIVDALSEIKDNSIDNSYKDIIEVIHEASEEYLNGKAEEKKSNSVKSIKID